MKRLPIAVLIMALLLFPATSRGEGLVLGLSSSDYFSMNPTTGQVTDLGLGPAGRGDFLSDVDEFAVASDGRVFSFSPGGFAFFYDPFSQQGESFSLQGQLFSTSEQVADLAQGTPGGPVYARNDFAELGVIDLQTKVASEIPLDTFTSADKVVVTTDGEVVIQSALNLLRVDPATGNTVDLNPIIFDAGFSAPNPSNVLGTDSRGNILFTTSPTNSSIVRLDPTSGVIDELQVDFNTFFLDYLTPGPDGSFLAGAALQGVRVVDDTTGTTLANAPFANGFTPRFAITVAVPEPTAAVLVAYGCCLALTTRRRIYFQ